MKRLYTILFILSVFAILIYLIVPEQHFSDSVYPMREGSLLTVYDDRADGGESDAHLSLSDSLLMFDCKLHTGNSFAWCGLLWNFDPDSANLYRNWMLVDTLILEMDVSGTDELLFKLWTFDPNVSKKDDKHSFRPLIKEITNIKPGVRRYVIPVSDLYTPDFWYEKQKVDTNLTFKHLENAARVELSAGWRSERGKLFEVKIKSIEAKGVSSFARGIMLFFFLAIITIAVGVRHKS